MRILWLTASLQHPAVRGSLRHYHFLRELGPRHAVTLVTVARTPAPAAARIELESYARGGLRVFEAPLAGGRIERYRAYRRAVVGMRAAVRDELARERYDVVLFHGKPAYGAIAGVAGIPVVADFCDATSLRLSTRLASATAREKPLLLARRVRVRRVERALVRAAAACAFIAPRDRAAVLGPAADAPVLPNGIDCAYWRRDGRAERAQGCLAFTGVLSYEPNADAALRLVEEVLPPLRELAGPVRTLVVGREPGEALRAAAEACGNVTVTGFVEDLRPYLEEATVFVAPVRFASGMQNKVLEALAMELPVVTTSAVADGLRVEGADPPPLVVAETPAATAEAVARLLADPPERARLAAAGRRFVEEHFDWTSSARGLEELCERASAAAPAAARAPTTTPLAT